jgi:hypothetical protein
MAGRNHHLIKLKPVKMYMRLNEPQQIKGKEKNGKNQKKVVTVTNGQKKHQKD